MGEALQDTSFLAALCWMVLFPMVSCRFMWDAACRHGYMSVVTTFAYLNAFLATVVNIAVLRLPPSPSCLTAAFCLVICSFVAGASLRDKDPADEVSVPPRASSR